MQASIYDVPGGFRAVMFDRFSGVKDQVSNCVMGVQRGQAYRVWNTGYGGGYPLPRAMAAESNSV